MSNQRIVDLTQGQLLKLPEVCARLAMSMPAVYRMMESGELAWVKLGKSRRVPLASVLRLIDRNTHGGNTAGV